MLDAMGRFFMDGYIADVVLAVMFVEVLLLLWYSRRKPAQFATKAVMFALLPGAFLALSLKAALIQAGWWWIALALIVALVSHIVDMRNRFLSRVTPSSTP
jgi:energy-converting hydrogenase Eha subunit A